MPTTDDIIAHIAATPSTGAMDQARDWIERLNVEQPSVEALDELHRLLHGGSGTRANRKARLAWVPFFVSLHGVDALCVWLQRLQVRGRAAAEGKRLEATEKLLLGLWQLMNTELGMQAMLANDGAGVMALSDLNDARACNLYFLARCIDSDAPSPGTAAVGVRVQCTAIKLLTSAVAYSSAGHERVCAALRYVGKLRPSFLGLPLGKAGHRLFRRLVEAPSTDEVLYCTMVLVAALLEPSACPLAAERLRLAHEFGLEQIVEVVRKRLRQDLGEEDDHVAAIGQHVELIVEALWRDKVDKDRTDALAVEEAAAAAVASLTSLMPHDAAGSPHRDDRGRPRSKLRAELQRLRSLNSALISQLEDVTAQSDAVKAPRPKPAPAHEAIHEAALEMAMREEAAVASAVESAGPSPVSAAEVDGAAAALAAIIVGSAAKATIRGAEVFAEAGGSRSASSSDETLREEVVRLFAIPKEEEPKRARAMQRRHSLAAAEKAAAKVQLLDPKTSHLKAIGIHALAASLPGTAPTDTAPPDAATPGTAPPASGSGTPRGDRAQAELAGTLRIVQALATGDANAFTHDQLVMLADLLPSDEDVALVAAHGGPTESLGVAEQFTRELGKLPFARERASAMLTRASFSERAEALRATLAAMQETLDAVQASDLRAISARSLRDFPLISAVLASPEAGASAETGVLRRILHDALHVYRLVNDDPAARGFRLSAISKFEHYMSADRKVNMLQCLGRWLDEGELVAELSRLEARLASIGRFVWSDVRHNVEEVGRTVDELRGLLARIDAERTTPSASGALASASAAALEGLASFVAGIEAFCGGSAATAIEELGEQHRRADATTRALLRFLAVDQRAWARPEETLATLHEVLLAIKQAHVHHILATRRAAAAALKMQELASSRKAGEGAENDGAQDGADERPGLVDGVAGRFAYGRSAAHDGQAGNDRSAELLRLMLRRASVSGAMDAAADDDEEEEEDDEFD